MKIAIRVDASLQIGSGHVMRCLTLATELKDNGAEIVFICRELSGNMLEYIKEKKFAVIPLSVPASPKQTCLQSGHAEWLQIPKIQDAEETTAALSDWGKADWLIVDHYALDADWEKHQRSVVRKIAVIDDLADRPHDCDLLLDQNFYLDGESRYRGLVPAHCRMLLGPQYCLLRPEFFIARQKLARTYESVKRVMVFFGGIDLHNATQKTLHALSKLDLQDVYIDVVIGGSNPNRHDIERLCRKIRNAVLHVQISNMADMMTEADLCVGGGGTATWERCCLGLPALAWPIADNQRKLLSDCAKSGIVYSPDFDDPDVMDIVNHIVPIMQNSYLRQHMGIAGMKHIDGRGVQRVAKMLMRPKVSLRPATLEDMRMVYEWRNHSSVRAVSRNTSSIEWVQHRTWFESVLNDSERFLFVAMHNEHPVGVLRFDLNKDEAEISLYLAPDQHGHGYGAAIVESGEAWLRNHHGEICEVVAEVMQDNVASQKLFDSCGYAASSMKYRKRVS